MGVMKLLTGNLLLFCILFYAQTNLTHGSLQSSISLKDPGTTFIPSSSMESSLQTVHVPSLLRCAKQCHEHQLCRTFVYDSQSLRCQLYQSDSTTGNITITNLTTSRVGQIRLSPQLYTNYNQTCNRCQMDRNLFCANSRCQCPLPTTFWDGKMCRNQLYYGGSCNVSSWCRNHLNLTCIFGSCQPVDAFCRLGETGIGFDDIPNQDPAQGTIPSGYKGFNWTDGFYLNTNATASTGYHNVRGSGSYIVWFNYGLTMELLNMNRTFAFYSCSLAAGWSDGRAVVITGYYRSTSLYSTSVIANLSPKTIVNVNWSGLTKIVFTTDQATGIDNLCIGFS